MSCLWYRTCNDVMHALPGMDTQASHPPYVYVAQQELLMDMPFTQAKQHLSKNNCLIFQHPKYRFCEPEHDEKDSHCHAQ